MYNTYVMFYSMHMHASLPSLSPSEAMHQRVLYCDISDITNHWTDK